MIPFPSKKYRVVYADPAWPYENFNSPKAKRGARKEYATMSMAEIAELPVAQIADNPSLLFLWVTFPLLPDAISVMRHWGFQYKTLAFSWIKLNRKTPGYAMGNGYFTRSNCEVCLLGVKGKWPQSWIKSHSVESLVVAPRGEHSAKPVEVRERIQQLVGKVPRIELFGRGPAGQGWDVWGREAVPEPVHQGVRIDRVWAMPNKWTFEIKPVRKLIEEEMQGMGGRWADPFAGKHGFALAPYSNDINPEAKANSHMDALEYLRKLNGNPVIAGQFDGALLDWPYSNNQYRVCYQEAGMPVNSAVFNAKYQASIKDQLARLIRPGGKCISFGWNSMGLGLKRGFKITRILMVAHGRLHNDTIVTVEVKQ